PDRERHDRGGGAGADQSTPHRGDGAGKGARGAVQLTTTRGFSGLMNVLRHVGEPRRFPPFPMEPELATFLKRHPVLCRSAVTWGSGSLPLEVTCYLGTEAPPEAYVSNARALVFQGAAVLVLRNADGLHLLPGGRIEPGESR